MQLLQERDENRFLSSIVVREPGDVIITLHGSDDSVIGQFTLKRAEGRGQPWGPLRLAGTGMSQANETIIRNWVGIAWPVE